jgi:hypothetical protein
VGEKRFRIGRATEEIREQGCPILRPIPSCKAGSEDHIGGSDGSTNATTWRGARYAVLERDLHPTIHALQAASAARRRPAADRGSLANSSYNLLHRRPERRHGPPRVGIICPEKPANVRVLARQWGGLTAGLTLPLAACAPGERI